MQNNEALKALLEDIQSGKVSVDQGVESLRDLPFQDIGHTVIDNHRMLRNGFPEVIYGEGKTKEQLVDIFGYMRERNNVLATRVDAEKAAFVLERFPDAEYNAMGRTLTFLKNEIEFKPGEIGIITAGTSDMDVAEEAKVTCEMLGSHASIISDIGVAGIHRLLGRLDNIRKYTVLIVIAGMEGALSSVVGGLVEQPIIAVPTSVGYGANFSGLSALLGMLTSCASGVTVVNIDNGFGAACAACKINNLVQR
ncbi:nickel pincer cofactor biosynthesis protein LarB [Pseudodesulfovibrio sp. zrk46]|uniref:nickel pincer cofactor biosynthesis protein LarB n=1 Tax=Pseudodesulfovibrio sp. zrk46 TaxID=2725288 RepID=UPI001449082B|nr:nickel pincer cofactor biosynthesis protein LarB [Pseudodesulfovibrio sp. zrk46]QJB56761.1 nickel pincer cofactor biosynthesis protein LarB [Pseudodesulfovibrio sp. zrk46]